MNIIKTTKINKGTFYLGDCLKVIKTFKDKSIDMILCDLPYGTTPCEWDNIIPMNKLWKQYKRIIKDNGAIILFGNEPFSSYLRISNIDWYKYDWYWEKERLTNVFQVKRRAGKNVENIMVFYNNQCIYNPQKIKHFGQLVNNKVGKNGKFSITLQGSGNIKPINYRDDRTRFPTQVIKINRDNNIKNIHPTQKPVALMKYLVRTYTNENDLVLDNCLGSGTTGIACANLNRKCIGIEIDEEYYNQAMERIKEQTQQQTLI